jgi:glycine C-acetyltransferase
MARPGGTTIATRSVTTDAATDRTSATLDFAANDYLGLRNHPRIRQAAIQGIERYGVGSGGIRDVAIGLASIEALEQRLASFKGLAGARMFQSGYAANIGVIPLLAGPGDAVILDRNTHPSSRDGARLSGASVAEYRHADPAALEEAVRDAAEAGSTRVVIVTDGVFGMDGDIAPLPDIVRIAKANGALVLVDDAHGSGVLGAGRGTAAHFGLTDSVDVQVGTASKAFGVIGGYVATDSREILEALAGARTVTHSTALPAHLADACLVALEIIEAEPERVARLWDNRHRLARGLQHAGLDIGSSATPIVPVIAGLPEVAMRLGERLRADGLLASVLVPPKVGADQSRLRLIATAAHAPADIDLAVRLIAAAGREARLC